VNATSGVEVVALESAWEVRERINEKVEDNLHC